jgi:hypothetical protein
MTFKIPDPSSRRNIYEVNPELRAVKAFKDLQPEEMLFVAYMGDAMNPYRFVEDEDEKLKMIIDAVNPATEERRKKYLSYQKHYSKEIEYYMTKFSSKSLVRKQQSLGALSNAHQQFCKILKGFSLPDEMDKIDDETLKNIKEIRDIIKNGIVGEFLKQIDGIEGQLLYSQQAAINPSSVSTDPDDMELGNI